MYVFRFTIELFIIIGEKNIKIMILTDEISFSKGFFCVRVCVCGGGGSNDAKVSVKQIETW